MKKQRHEFKNSVLRGGSRVIECRTCGYWHIHPMLTREELRKFYAEKYFSRQQQVNNRTMTDKKRDREGFYRLQYADRLRRILKHLPRKMPKTIVDIGTGYGDFLAFLREQGWATQGIEPSIEIGPERDQARRLGIMQADVDSIGDLHLHKSSVVTLNNVLEHIREPRKILEDVRRDLLLESGLLYVVVPNDFSVMQTVMEKAGCCEGKKNYWVCLPDHLNYWSIDSITAFVERCGYKVLQVTVDFPMELFVLMGDNYIQNPHHGRRAHLRRVRLEKNIERAGAYEFKEKLYRSFAACGIGRDVHVIATIK